MEMRSSIFLIFFVLLLLFLPLVEGISFRVSDAKDVNNPSFDIIAVGAYERNGTQYLWLQLRGSVDLEPSNYTKNYEVNITFENGSYLHIYLLIWEDKEEVMSFIRSSRGWNYKFDNYSTKNGNVTFWLSSKEFLSYGNVKKITFIAGEENLQEDKVVCLDFAYYPPEKESNQGNRNSDNMAIYIISAAIVMATIIALLIFRRKAR